MEFEVGLVPSLVRLLALPRPALAHRFDVGDGTPASCTEMALRHALSVAAAPGDLTIRFNCGHLPVSIILSEFAEVPNIGRVHLIPPDNTTIDGGGLITLVGGGAATVDTV